MAEASVWAISPEEKDLVVSVVMAVARGESELAQHTVAQAIRNSCETFDMDVSEVIREFNWPIYNNGTPTASAIHVVEMVIDGTNAINADIHYAYNANIQDGAWHESKVSARLEPCAFLRRYMSQTKRGAQI